MEVDCCKAKWFYSGPFRFLDKRRNTKVSQTEISYTGEDFMEEKLRAREINSLRVTQLVTQAAESIFST